MEEFEDITEGLAEIFEEAQTESIHNVMERNNVYMQNHTTECNSWLYM